MDAATLMHGLQGSLRAAEAEPTAGSLALAVAFVALLPLALIVPMSLICLAVAAKLPPLAAAAVILAGAEANTVIAWTLARTVFGSRLEAWLERRGGWIGSVRDGARREPLKWAFFARYMPAPFIAVPMVLSSAGVGLGTTVLGGLLGMLPWTALYVYVAHAGRQSSVAGITRAVAILILGVVLLRLLRLRFKARPAAESGPLKPRADGPPLIRLYTIPGQDLSDDARRDLAALRDALGFEVDESPISPGETGPDARYRDHAPVAMLGGERLFNYQMDENALRERLRRLGPAKEKA
jgi:uncharacterized membrane protein YdjX (TVP38/TMEM64 family)